jgi:D-tyrosyl-tRNA(Tyr) deacylase
LRVVVQRVREADVSVEKKIIGKIGVGCVLLIGVAASDTEDDVRYVADKCATLRIFPDEHNKLNRSLIDVHGEILAISQFTLLGNVSRGRRPSFVDAADPEKGEKFYELFIEHLRVEHGLHVETGLFGAMMDIRLINDGPVTLVIDSKNV